MNIALRLIVCTCAHVRIYYIAYNRATRSCHPSHLFYICVGPLKRDVCVCVFVCLY